MHFGPEAEIGARSLNHLNNNAMIAVTVKKR